jgi:hypothetical protein
LFFLLRKRSLVSLGVLLVDYLSLQTQAFRSRKRNLVL